MLLAFDTSTAYISVAVYDEEADAVLAERNSIGPMQHGEQLAPAISACIGGADLVRQDITAIAVGVGPGPYTGLRVGVVTARTMGLALEVPVYGVCSLDATALASGLNKPFLVTSDARRKEVFWAAYDETRSRLEGPFVDRPADLPTDRPVIGLPGEPVFPSAVWIARAVAGELVELMDPEPVYLRRPDAVTPGPPKKVS